MQIIHVGALPAWAICLCVWRLCPALRGMSARAKCSGGMPHAHGFGCRLYVCVVVAAVVRKAAWCSMCVRMLDFLLICGAWFGLLLCFGFGA